MHCSALSRLTGKLLFIAGPMIIFCLILLPENSYAKDSSDQAFREKSSQTVSVENIPAPSKNNRYDLTAVIQYALKHNPNLRIAGKAVESETYGIDAAKADRMPRIDFGSGITRYRYDTPLTPVVLKPPIGPGTDFPDFERTIWDTGVSFKLPLFRGGRLYRAVNVAEIRKTIAQDNYKMSKQELIYNLTNVYYKIGQLEKLLLAHEASVEQLELHKKNVELFLKTGTVPQLDLLKTEVELSHAMEQRLLTRNSLASTYELLKSLMGMDEMHSEISIDGEHTRVDTRPVLEESLKRAFSQRADYKAVAKKRLIGDERVKIAQGKRLPDLFAAAQYGGNAGHELAFKENWNAGLRLTMPILDGGLIRSEINKERVELEKAKEEERSLKLAITREVRDAHLSIINAQERIEVTRRAIESAKENLRVELLKYETGAGTNTDVIDARTVLLRTETDYYQAFFDKESAFAYFKKAVGEDEYDEEAQK